MMCKSATYSPESNRVAVLGCRLGAGRHVCHGSHIYTHKYVCVCIVGEQSGHTASIAYTTQNTYQIYANIIISSKDPPSSIVLSLHQLRMIISLSSETKSQTEFFLNLQRKRDINSILSKLLAEWNSI